MKREIVRVTADNKLRCPIHGKIEAEYREQDPAPCGCAFIWEQGEHHPVLVRVPSAVEDRRIMQNWLGD